MLLDSRTVILVSAIVSAAVALCLLATLDVQLRRFRQAQRLWTRGAFVMPAGWLLLALRGAMPDFPANVVGHGLLAFGLAECVCAQRELSGRSGAWRVPYAIVATIVVTALLFGAFVPNDRIGAILIALQQAALGVLLAAHAWSVGPTEKRTPGRWLMIGMAGAGAAVLVLSALVPTPGTQSVLFAYAALAPVTLTCAFVLIGNERVSAELAHTATTDPLTGLMNRRAMQELARGLLADAKRHGRAFALLVVDIDHFKQINEALGQLAGDEVLRALVFAFAKEIREGDYLGRYGGEEFVIVLPGTSLGGARELAERLRRTVERQPFVIQGAEVAVRVSIGCAEAGQTDDLDTALQRADRALDEAKSQGRNRVVVASVSGV